MITKKQQEEIDNARSILRSYGYYVENLWHIEDVKLNHECDDDDAYDILDNALSNEATFEQIWLAIDTEIQSIKSGS